MQDNHLKLYKEINLSMLKINLNGILKKKVQITHKIGKINEKTEGTKRK